MVEKDESSSAKSAEEIKQRKEKAWSRIQSGVDAYVETQMMQSQVNVVRDIQESNARNMEETKEFV